jgi:thiol-disulfide isomerase/thioredoxin
MRPLAAILPAVALLLAACTSGGATATAGQASGEAWRSASLTDVVTGEVFRIDDSRGKLVALESMAIWCGNCRVQQGEAQAALERVRSPDVVYISLDVDPNERAEDLADYARREGFTWRFAVASPEMSRSLAATFGDQILSPSATPLVILGPDGELIEKHIGVKGADELAAMFEDHLP